MSAGHGGGKCWAGGGGGGYSIVSRRTAKGNQALLVAAGGGGGETAVTYSLIQLFISSFRRVFGWSAWKWTRRDIVRNISITI